MECLLNVQSLVYIYSFQLKCACSLSVFAFEFVNTFLNWMSYKRVFCVYSTENITHYLKICKQVGTNVVFKSNLGSVLTSE